MPSDKERFESIEKVTFKGYINYQEQIAEMAKKVFQEDPSSFDLCFWKEKIEEQSPGTGPSHVAWHLDRWVQVQREGVDPFQKYLKEEGKEFTPRKRKKKVRKVVKSTNPTNPTNPDDVKEQSSKPSSEQNSKQNSKPSLSLMSIPFEDVKGIGAGTANNVRNHIQEKGLASLQELFLSNIEEVKGMGTTTVERLKKLTSYSEEDLDLPEVMTFSYASIDGLGKGTEKNILAFIRKEGITTWDQLFNSDILEVKGMGTKTLERLKETVNEKF